jgi:membrane protein DedA with SNARE-associated domain
MLFFPIQYWLAKYSYLALYILLMTGIIGLPIPDETILAFSGYLINQKELILVPTLVAAFLGSATGITVSYLLGRLIGIIALKRAGKFLHISEKSLEKGELWFEKLGKWTLSFGYFIPGVRHIVAIIAGSTKLKFHVFALFAYSGAIVWTFTFILIGYYVGEKWEGLIEKIHKHFVFAGIVVIIIIAGYTLIKIFLNKKRKS